MKVYNLSVRLFALVFSMIWAVEATYDICVISKGKDEAEYLRNYKLPNPRTYIISKGYNFTKGHTEVLTTKIIPLRPNLEVAEGDVWKSEGVFLGSLIKIDTKY